MRPAFRLHALAVAALLTIVGPSVGAPAVALAQSQSPAAISLDPVCGPAGSSGTYSITVKGDNFNPFTSVLVTFDHDTGGRPESFQAQSDGFGHFQTSITPRQRAGNGPYVVYADDFKLRSAQATFTVPCPPQVGPNARFAPTLQFDPEVGPPGFVAAVTGQGFPPGAQVALSWDAIPAYEFATPVAADANGAITVAPEGFVIFSHTPVGVYTLKATPGAGSPAFAEVDAQFTVVPPPLQPPDFRVRS